MLIYVSNCLAERNKGKYIKSVICVFVRQICANSIDFQTIESFSGTFLVDKIVLSFVPNHFSTQYFNNIDVSCQKFRKTIQIDCYNKTRVMIA